jgi:hypothetical protein
MKALICFLNRLYKWSETWEKRHPKARTALMWLSIIIFSIAVVSLMYAFSIPFGLVTILSTDALRALIEGEATIIGFFGLVAIYALTSYDNRIEKIEDRMDDNFETRNALRWITEFPKGPSLPTGNLTKYKERREALVKRKWLFTKSIIISLGTLFISFFLFIYIYGILTINDIDVQATLPTTFPLLVGALTFLFVGVLSIITMLIGIGKEPTANPSPDN